MNLLQMWNDDSAKKKAGLQTEADEFDAIFQRAENPRPGDAARLSELASILGIDPKMIPPRLAAIIGKAKAERECAEVQELLKVLRSQESSLKKLMGEIITGDSVDLADALCLVYHILPIGIRVPLEPLTRDSFTSDFLHARGWVQVEGNCWKNPKTGKSPVKAQAILEEFRQISDPIAPLTKQWIRKRAFAAERAAKPAVTSETTPAESPETLGEK